MLFCIYSDSPTTSASSPCGHQDALPYECRSDAHCYVPGDSFGVLPHPASISRIPSGYWSVRGHKRGYLADRVYHYAGRQGLPLRPVALPGAVSTSAIFKRDRCQSGRAFACCVHWFGYDSCGRPGYGRRSPCQNCIRFTRWHCLHTT